MKYTASHWGAYRIEGESLAPVEGDPAPSRIGRGWVSAARDSGSRILRPAIRAGWLEGDGGTARGDDRYVEVTWDRAIEAAAGEIDRVRQAHGNGAIYAGSYGWASAGRFHHAQSQLRRFLNLVGGAVSSRETYSHAAAEVILPHVVGMTNRVFQDEMTSWPLVAEHCELLVAFGGISPRTAQITSAGTSRHEVGDWLDRLGARIVNVSPRRSDLPQAEWMSVRPNTDVALMLALAHTLSVEGLYDEAFLARCTSGWPAFRAYLLGENDGQAKDADWAGPLCDLEPERIRALAREMAAKRTMISVTWGLQRADHGEQAVWAGLALAAMLGQIGQPGTGTGFGFGYGSTTPVGRPSKLYPWPSVPQGRNPVADFIPVARIADMLERPGESYDYDLGTRTYPDIRLVWWAGGNPFHHHQDLDRLARAWTRPETVIVNEHSWTATARRADIVLPSTTPLERDDLMLSRRDPTLIYMSAMFPPMGEALDDHEILRRLAARLGVEDAFTEGRDVEGWLRHLWAGTRAVAADYGADLPEFDAFREVGRFDMPDADETRVQLGAFVADPEAAPLATESGRITLFNEAIAAAKLPDCPGHPAWMEPVESLLDAPEGALHLISGQPDTRLHAQNDRGSEAQSDKIEGREPCYLHPETAAANGLSEGQILRLHNSRGATLAGLRLDEGMRRDCISLATGAWYDPAIVDGARLELGGNPNAVTLDRGCSRLSQGNMAHTALVFVEAWEGPLPPLTVDRPPPLV
ncbi:molybdopterin-dependent oxidoreductase [Palleronia sp. LCG004]|uniref:molybdopterin-dependent oxidoreductase n=1 Tax=Palleronia sp. LCG004 TaxID=3079304 RepID=UPI0029431EEC|nr:molybdopterin-dependent oxidoreductase [Palleronia sp. LCG004]WOI56284.1 molybdopterin-dependent oxidoreductase [Palleronia sp. LCG004]